MTPVTPEMVKGLWDFLSQTYQTEIVPKEKSLVMKVVAQTLDLLQITDKQSFMTRFTTTLGRVIYVPFTPGVPTPLHSLESQLSIAAHEHQHVIQLDAKGGGFTFMYNYLASQAWRAAYEAEAYRVSMTMQYRLRGSMSSPMSYALLLKSYGIDQAGQDYAAEFLDLAVPSIRRGGIPDEAARVSLYWLQDNHPGVVRDV